ncbi:FAD-dependent oxidoreductase [Undibacterium terreum]|uniref:FAD-dependent oxidoreductase n=1 Tax=Undibacterium terreum TaxID=1224302 RepID=UPI001E4DAC3C|nr:FAD-dependent monooxygenase [Undibacterium terreum]
MVIKDKTIAIVGCGPGGLTLARLLQMQGANVRVYERDANAQARVQGATLDLHEESGLRALQAAGLMDAFRASYRPDAGRVRIVDQDAVIVTDQHGDAGYNEAARRSIAAPCAIYCWRHLSPALSYGIATSQEWQPMGVDGKSLSRAALLLLRILSLLPTAPIPKYVLTLPASSLFIPG